MPAGVGGNQLNDALTAAKLLATTIDTHLLMSTLQRFSQGQTVTNPADRRTLAAMLTVLLKG